MVYVPGGEFTIGSPESEAGRQPNEGPQYKAKVGNFWMGKCEVTWDDWDLFWYDENVPQGRSSRREEARAGRRHAADEHVRGRDLRPRPRRPPGPVHDAPRRDDVLQLACGRRPAAPIACRPRPSGNTPPAAAKATPPYFFGNDPKKLDDYAWFKDNSQDDGLPGQAEGVHAQGRHAQAEPVRHPRHLRQRLGVDARPVRPEGYEKCAMNKLNIRPGDGADGGQVVARDPRRVVGRQGGPLRSAARRFSEESWKKQDPQEPQSIWWLTRMDVVGFRVVLAEEEQPELVGLKPKVVKKTE